MKQGAAIDFNIVQSIIDFLPMGVYVLNRERKMRWVNRRIMQRLQEGNVSQYQEKYCYKEIFKRKMPCDNCPALKTFETGLMQHAEIVSEYKREPRHYLISTAILRGSETDKEDYIIETVQDITYRKGPMKNFAVSMILMLPLLIMPLSLFLLSTKTGLS
jgi:hypothetical protein